MWSTPTCKAVLRQGFEAMQPVLCNRHAARPDRSAGSWPLFMPRPVWPFEGVVPANAEHTAPGMASTRQSWDRVRWYGIGLSLPLARLGLLAASQQGRIQSVGPLGSSAAVAVKSQSEIHLLVDADIHGTEAIRGAIRILQRKKDGAVKTKIFAPPARAENAKWKRLFDEKDVCFHPIARGSDATGEANDDAVVAELKRLAAQTSSVGCIALMTSDSDFVDIVAWAIRRGTDVIVMTSRLDASSDRNFRSAGAEVVMMSVPGETTGTNVRAVLHPSGSGTVQLAERFTYALHSEEEIMTVMSFLQDLQYRKDKGYLVQSIAKFWFTNQLGPLTVFPGQCAIKAVLARVNQSGTSLYARYKKQLAYFLPVSARSTITKVHLQTYGSRPARAVFRGGGPFMLEDSADVVSRALKKLGFLDSKWNSDLSEALLAFVNVADNKKILRKQFDALPSNDDTASHVEDRPRHAFLSNQSDGQWRIAPKDSAAREILCKEGFLDTKDASKGKVLKAMKKYASKHQLPKMQNYHSYVYQTLGADRAVQPTAIGTVHFQP